MALHVDGDSVEVDLDPGVSRPRKFGTTGPRGRGSGCRRGSIGSTASEGSSTLDRLERGGLRGVISSREVEEVVVSEGGEIAARVHVSLELRRADVDGVEEGRRSLFNALVRGLSAGEELPDLLEAATNGFDGVLDGLPGVMPVEAVVKEERDIAVGDPNVEKGQGGATRGAEAEGRSASKPASRLLLRP